MSDALPLPPRPNLEQYKKRAKDLVKICKSADRDALRAWATEWIEALVKLEVVALLVRSGARLDPQWYEDDEDRRRAATKMRSDPRMLAALRGEMPTT